jgi:hypothetical protein
MPDLTPKDIRPMDARWVAGFSNWGGVSPYDIFRGWTDDAHKLFPHYPDGLRIVGDGHDPDRYPWVPKRLKRDGLDGREAIALINATSFRGTSVILRRTIQKQPTIWSLHAWFDDLEVYRSRKRVDLSTIPDIAAAAALILAVDAERMLRRAAEDPTGPRIQICIAHNLSEDMNAHFVETVHGHLQTRAIQIEPESWSGSPVYVVRA